jgi:integrase
MATARARHGSYIFQRPGSPNWYIKLRSPGSRRLEKSLGTSDKLEAERLAATMIGDHKAVLLAARPRLEWIPHKLTPGEKVGPNGERVIATEREIIYLDATTGALLRTEPNGPAQRLVNLPMGAVIVGDNPTQPLAELRRMGPVVNLARLERAAPRNDDDAVMQTYLDHRNITGYNRREAETVWATFKKLTDGKPLKDATREDGRVLVKHFMDQELKVATINKKIGWLRSAVNLAIDEDKSGRWTFNPFSHVVPAVEDELERHPLSEAELKICKRNLAKLSEHDALLFRVLACTGMRLGEAFQIDGETFERRIRYCIVGTKTSQSKRRVPFPVDLLPHLPKKITGPLFTGGTRAASKRLNRFLDDCGLADPSIVVHSLRHRAADRLRAYECPPDIRHELLGHEEETVAAGYGEGSPVRVLRRWIDKIGF